MAGVTAALIFLGWFRREWGAPKHDAPTILLSN
jgi:hypothetical protein